MLPQDISHEGRRPGNEGLPAHGADVPPPHAEGGKGHSLQGELPRGPA